MKKTIVICDSCENYIPENYEDKVVVEQANSQGIHRTKFDVCVDCMNSIKKMFHLAT